MKESEECSYEANYNTKDLILYALSIGIEPSSSSSSSNKEEADYNHNSTYDDFRFLYENHPQFAGFPTFCLALTFWAQTMKKQNEGTRRTTTTNTTTTSRIPVFPPPLMRKEEVIPRRYLVNGGGDLDLSRYPLIHSWQSIVWRQQLPVPHAGNKKHTERFDNCISTRLNIDIISVVPKSIGTFVTSQTQVTVLGKEVGTNHSQRKQNPSGLCTMQSTALVLGISPKNVLPYDSGVQRMTMNTSSNNIFDDDEDPIFEFVYPTISTQALLYRLSSGDSNHIHVDTSVSEQLQSDKKAPLLHGLFTLAIGCRAVMKLIDPDTDDIEILEGKFAQPAFVGDILKVKVWDVKNDNVSKNSSNTSNKKKCFRFVIVNDETDVEVLTNGYACFTTNVSSNEINNPIVVSKL